MPYILGKTRTQQQNLIPMRDLMLQFFTRYDRSKFHVTNIQKIMKLFRAYLKFTRTKFKKNPHEQAVSLSIAKPYRYCQHRYRPGKKVKNNRIIFFIREIKQTFEITNQKLISPRYLTKKISLRQIHTIKLFTTFVARNRS